jgi:tetratricopeptide (TPR) repeat protein
MGLGSRGPLSAAAPSTTGATGDSAVIPGYTVTGELGRGGMGVVYHARQAGLNRPVALKMLLGDGPGGEAELIRFIAEAEAVAAVKHPHVVQVYGYGENGGRPFMALEFCPGGSLAQRLRAAARRKGPAGRGPFPPADAADLVRRLAEGVAAAHEQGIVHRDLKPGNVLFDEAGEPKVSDFGLAKRGQGHVELTRPDAVMGTPAYMSPEQAKGGSKFVGPPADVWALGVILYECLTGRRPFEADSVVAMLRQVTDREPASVRSHSREIPRDLELIVRKCLAKEPHERYPTAKELADDLRRFLNGEPVVARPAGAAERLIKWVRRNPGYAALWGGLALALVAGTTASLAFAARASARAEAERAARAEATAAAEAEREAKVAAEDANRVAAARLGQAEKAYDVLAGVFQDINPVTGTDDRPLAAVLKERMERAAGELDEAAIVDPLSLARMRTDLATALTGLDSPALAVELAGKALAVRREKLGPNTRDTLFTQNTLGLAHLTAGRPDLAIPLHEDARPRLAAIAPNDRLTVNNLSNLGSAYVETGRFALAVPLFEEVWERARAAYGAADPVTLNILGNLAVGYMKIGQPNRALGLCEDALKGLRATLPADHPAVLKVLNNLAATHMHTGRPDKALIAYRDALAGLERTLGPDNPSTLLSRLGVAQALIALQQFEEVTPILEALVPLFEARLGKTTPNTLIATGELGQVYKRTGRPDLAVPLYERVRAGWVAIRGPEHPDTLVATSNLAGVLYDAGRLHEAILLYETVLAGRIKALDWDNPATLNAASNLGFMYEKAGRWADAARVYGDRLNAIRRQFPAGGANLLGPLVYLGNAYLRDGKYTAAESTLREALAVAEEFVPQQAGTFRLKSLLGAALVGQGKTEEAGPLVTDGHAGVAARAAQFPPDQRAERLAEVLGPLVAYYKAAGKAAEAKKWQAELDRLVPAVAPSPRVVGR